MSNAPSDDTLVVAALAGDRAQFDQLVVRHHARVVGLLRHLAKAPDIADDLAQETFLQAWQKLSGYSRAGRFGAWLSSIAYRCFLQKARRGRLEGELFSSDEPPDQPDARTLEDVPHQLAKSGDPDMTELLRLCSRRQAEALYMNFVLELTHDEIAEITAQPLGTVKSHIQRGKACIKKWLLAKPSTELEQTAVQHG